MKKFKISWTPFASRCLDEIYTYVKNKERSEIPALKLIVRLSERVEQLETYAESGTPEALLKAIGQDSRYLLEASYKIIYEVKGNEIIITDVFHTSQNPVKITQRKSS